MKRAPKRGAALLLILAVILVLLGTTVLKAYATIFWVSGLIFMILAAWMLLRQS